jgi:hypothetical protein
MVNSCVLYVLGGPRRLGFDLALLSHNLKVTISTWFGWRIKVF